MSPRRTFWIGAGWKMNKTLAESLDYAARLEGFSGLSHPLIRTFVIPPFTSVRQVKEALARSPVLVGAQNMHWESDGAFTGEISAPMLTDCGVDLVEIGHSERREFFGETDERVGLKTAAAVRAGLMPLICIGETREQRDAGVSDAVLEMQVRYALGRLSGEQRDASLLLAYEPVWAIGSGGVPAPADYVDERHAGIIRVGQALLGRRLACLYGGSVDLDNCRGYARCANVDGLFIGRAAWDIETLFKIFHHCEAELA